MRHRTKFPEFIISFLGRFWTCLCLIYVIAQTSVPMPDDEGEYKDGEHEGKSCPSKEKKSASVDAWPEHLTI